MGYLFPDIPLLQIPKFMDNQICGSPTCLLSTWLMCSGCVMRPFWETGTGTYRFLRSLEGQKWTLPVLSQNWKVPIFGLLDVLEGFQRVRRLNMASLILRSVSKCDQSTVPVTFNRQHSEISGSWWGKTMCLESTDMEVPPVCIHILYLQCSIVCRMLACQGEWQHNSKFTQK